jgi:hypothetical protein
VRENTMQIATVENNKIVAVATEQEVATVDRGTASPIATSPANWRRRATKSPPQQKHHYFSFGSKGKEKLLNGVIRLGGCEWYLSWQSDASLF